MSYSSHLDLALLPVLTLLPPLPGQNSPSCDPHNKSLPFLTAFLETQSIRETFPSNGAIASPNTSIGSIWKRPSPGYPVDTWLEKQRVLAFQKKRTSVLWGRHSPCWDSWLCGSRAPPAHGGCGVYRG